MWLWVALLASEVSRCERAELRIFSIVRIPAPSRPAGKPTATQPNEHDDYPSPKFDKSRSNAAFAVLDYLMGQPQCLSTTESISAIRRMVSWRATTILW
jgi:hypothetical protein